ncbi:histone-lysine N-methyltransferase EHMT2-like isoform X3 [Eriocheir sinensis]|uniref:histone-lysine N-methyltransferase EHMT2-like isoform X3 n=1 Tax=Eriocheir sinensis TaxID=95602 RepID=UPI0021C84FAF|nr:histone-lysine N-methyltransferase EHMT2-like isoform X3 [Eriocheir sinensis]
MSSQEVFGKGVQGRIAGKNIPVESETRTQQLPKGKKQKNKGRYRKKKLLLTRKKGTAHKRYSQNIFEAVSRGIQSDSEIKGASQSEDEAHILGKKLPRTDGLPDKDSDSSSDGSEKSRETKSENYNSEVKVPGSEESENSLSELQKKLDTMETSPQSGDQKNKLLEMMSREFNSGSIQEGSVSLDPKKSARTPRLTRKRKSEVIDAPEKTPEILASQQSPIATVSSIFHNPITSALKKIRKEPLENVPLPTSPVTPGRTRRSTQERKSGSEKDPSEEVTGISEPPEVVESKTEEVPLLEKTTPDTRGRKRAKVRGRSLVDEEEGNDSDNESPVIPVRGRGKTQSSSEEDCHATCSDSPSSVKSRSRIMKGSVEVETASTGGQIKGKNKVPFKDEPNSDFKCRGKQKPEGDKAEDPQSLSFASNKSRRIAKPSDESINPVGMSTSSVGTMSTRSRVKTEPEKEASVETESATQARRSTTPVRGESTPQSELKRSQRILLSRESSSDSSLSCKKGTLKPMAEIIKKPDTPTPPAKPPPTRPKKDDESLWTKTGKKKKKHFKGLSYSFNTRKKKGKGKGGHGRQGLDTSQETDSVVSEEIDMESVDSSSQDVPSEQLSNQDQDGIEDRLSEGEGEGDNDVEMDNVEGANITGDDTSMKECSIEKVLTDSSDVEENSKSLETVQTEIAEKEEKLDEACEDSVKTVKSELPEVRKENTDMSNKETKSTQICNIQGSTASKISAVVKYDPPPAPSDIKAEHSDPLEEVKSNSVKPELCEDVSKGKSPREVEGAGKLDSDKLVQTECQGKGMRIKKVPPGLSVFSSPSHVSHVTVQKMIAEKEHSTLPPKVLSSPEVSCSVSESAFSPGAEVEVHVPEKSSDETLREVPAPSSARKSVNNITGFSDLPSSKPDSSPQTQPMSKKLHVTKMTESDCKNELASQTSKEPLGIQDETLRPLGRRRQSISKKKFEDLAPEGHNSDSSDSMSEPRLPGEGVRKSKRLSRHSSPHGLSFAAPESPEGPGKGQSKPIGSQSANVTPASPGEHLCYSILSPPVNLTQSCQQQGNVKSAAPTLTNALCKCRMKYNPLAIVTTGEVYCQAIDSFDGRMIGCCNIVTNNRLLRVSGKIPFMLLCDNHRRRLRQHNCCPCCGLFCTQGVFYECSWDKGGLRHYYHKLCCLVLNGTTLCPHCGSSDSPQEVQLELMLTRKPVVYLQQHQERKELSARITWSKKEAPEDSADADIATGNEPSLELRNGRIISAVKLPFGCGREKLQEAIRCITEGKSVIKPTSKGMYLACKQNDIEKLLHALVSGLSPNVKVKECGSQTGLHVAAAYGSVAALHILVMGGATIDMTDNQLMTPLMIAITKEQNEVVHYLVQAGASLMAKVGIQKTQDGMTCLHLAAKCGNLTACQHILDSGRLTRHAVNMQDEGGWTPLVWASENKFAHVVKFLLDRGGNPQLCDVEQNTALHWAAFSGSTHICSMVLDRGCSLRSMNAHGDTPLHIAARQNHTDAVILLLTRGAQLDVLNTKSQTPIDCALPDTDVYLQLTLNSKVLEIMKQNNIRTEKILSSDIAGGKEEVPIPCVNGADEDELPKDYLYIAENCEASNVTIDRTITSLKWCECEDGCNAEHCGCGQLNFQCWFDPDGRLLPEFNYADPPMIFECNRACRCNKLSCNNRVVQHGISAHMQLFKTVGKGWGVRALKTIQKGSYVCEYVGEIITDLEADQRHDDSYLFDLDNRDSETFCIDARSYGNIARFINHLCEANLTPVKVFIDHQDLTFPRIALFANRDIEADEELGFDYGEKFWMIKYKQFTCTCSSEKCKYSSETIHTTLENYNRKLRELQEAA